MLVLDAAVVHHDQPTLGKPRAVDALPERPQQPPGQLRACIHGRDKRRRLGGRRRVGQYAYLKRLESRMQVVVDHLQASAFLDVHAQGGPDARIGDEIASLKGRVLIPTHLWKVVYSPKRRQAGAYLVTNDETRTYSALSVSELERMIGIAPLPGVPQRVRDAAMSLPVPSSEGGRHAGTKRKRGGAVPESDYSLSDLARRTIETILKKLK